MIAARRWAALGLLAAQAAMAQGEDPQQLMQALEARVLAAPRVTIEADIQASGALAAHLAGRLSLQERNHATGSWQGELRGAPVELGLASDGRALELTAGGVARSEAAARESNHALLAGALRMGLLHNLLRLNAAQGPDHAAGGLEAWATLDAFRPTTFAMAGDIRGAMSFGYDLVADGINLGSVRLWLDPLTNLPRRRQAVLHGSEGDTTVVEDYRRFSLD